MDSEGRLPGDDGYDKNTRGKVTPEKLEELGLPELAGDRRLELGIEEPVNKMNLGGLVPGAGFNRDSVPTLLTPGEFVMSRDAVKEFGPDVLSSMNSFRGGGLMPTMASSPAINTNDSLRKRLSNPARYRPGGVVTSNSGMKVKGNGVDTQYIQPATVQIGEAVRVFTKDSC